ncbi:hypothetical protein Tco_0196079 [Tanacetum coccineum]
MLGRGWGKLQLNWGSGLIRKQQKMIIMIKQKDASGTLDRKRATPTEAKQADGCSMLETELWSRSHPGKESYVSVSGGKLKPEVRRDLSKLLAKVGKGDCPTMLETSSRVEQSSPYFPCINI